MFTVYILYSQNLRRHYIGQTDNLEKRIEEHRNKLHLHSFTAKTDDWELFLYLACASRDQARRVEAFLKKMRNTSYYARLQADKNMQKDILERHL